MSAALALDASDDAAPQAEREPWEGWSLGADTWAFHRDFLRVVGRPCAHLEYSNLIAQVRRDVAEPLPIYRHTNAKTRYYRVVLLDGTPVVVRGSWQRLVAVKPADYTPAPPRVWQIKPARVKPAKAETRPHPPVAETPAPITPPPPAKPLRATTLTLTNPKATQVAAAKLRRFGVGTSGLDSSK